MCNRFFESDVIFILPNQIIGDHNNPIIEDHPKRVEIEAITSFFKGLFPQHSPSLLFFKRPASLDTAKHDISHIANYYCTI